VNIPGRIAAILLAGYTIFVVSFILFQRRFIYFPSREYPLTPAALGLTFTSVALTAADGVRLTGWWVPCLRGGKDIPGRNETLRMTSGGGSSAADAGAAGPVVLFFHGNAANLSALVALAGFFHARGVSFFAVDYRGYGTSAGKPSEAGFTLDARAAWDWLRAQGVPRGRIVIYGHSLGAALAARLAAEELVAGVVLEGSFPSLYAIARYHCPWLILPAFLFRDRFETAHWVSRSRCPVLIVHGEHDSISPVAFGRDVFASAPEPKRFFLIPEAGHNDMLAERPEVLTAITKFVARSARL
jgi:fermentation-respiration switch protein FrsA (DUF1100 family)